jgi:hypothetical protein
MAIETDIMAALFARVSTIVLAPVLPATSIAWPNVTFTPPANQRYLRVQFVPNVANRLLIDSEGPHQHLGLLQLSIYGKKNTGEAAVRAEAAAVAAHFPCDLKLYSGAVGVRITKRPDVRDLIFEDAAVQIPVMIAWEVYA